MTKSCGCLQASVLLSFSCIWVRTSVCHSTLWTPSEEACGGDKVQVVQETDTKLAWQEGLLKSGNCSLGTAMAREVEAQAA